MKSVVIMAFMFLTLAVGANAQENQRVFTAEEQAIVDLSNSKWDWMAEMNVEKLAELFHENSQFVHMGGWKPSVPAASGTRKPRYTMCRWNLLQERQPFTAGFI